MQAPLGPAGCCGLVRCVADPDHLGSGHGVQDLHQSLGVGSRAWVPISSCILRSFGCITYSLHRAQPSFQALASIAAGAKPTYLTVPTSFPCVQDIAEDDVDSDLDLD
mmetsp:Transcript_26683/g.38161  ORF Transcript_26683/g.38161 Transcript_26683/m.38161 type:complete len:108 (-) Transcript_26683:311-634(-)